MKLHTREQYLNTLKWIERFNQDYADAVKSGPPPDVHVRIYQAGLDAILSQVADLKRDAQEYEQDTLTHPECLRTGICQETEGFKGGPHEGLDMCEDGCVWFQPKKK